MLQEAAIPPEPDHEASQDRGQGHSLRSRPFGQTLDRDSWRGFTGGYRSDGRFRALPPSWSTPFAADQTRSRVSALIAHAPADQAELADAVIRAEKRQRTIRGRRILLIMDSVASATLFATVAAVYEAVLIALVARAGGARDTLMDDVRDVRRLLTEQPLDPAAQLLKGRDWEQYAADSPGQRKDLELRLKELLHPDLVAMRERELAEETEQFERFKKQHEKRRRALLRLADNVERLGEQNVKQWLEKEGWNREKVDRYLEEAKQAKSETPEIRNSWLEKDPAKSKYTLPAEEGDRGVVLLEVLAALACQPPMPRRVRKSEHGTVESCDAQVPTLASPDQAKTWAAQVLNKLRPPISLMAGRNKKIDTLIEAAKAQGYVRLSEKTAQSDDPSILIEVERAEERLRATSVHAVSALGETYVAAIGLQISEAEWNATRPSRKYRWALAAGLVIGAVVFVIGVVVPLLAAGAPIWLTVDVPAYMLGVVAVSLLIIARSYVLKL